MNPTANETDTPFPLSLPFPELKRVAKALKQENKRLPDAMTKLDPKTHADQSARSGGRLVEVWRSNKYLAQIYAPVDGAGMERISICRCEIDTTNRRWRDGLSWEELMQIKREVGRGDSDAMEAYPRDSRIVNVANLRHLFVSKTRVDWMWGDEP